MPTSVLNAYSSAYPLITNRIRSSIYLQSSPQAFIASQIDVTIGHPIRTWSFPGLPRNNYGFILEEIDGSGNPVAVLAKFDVVPGEMDGELVRDDEQIKVGTTPGFTAGLNTFTFDGTGGKPDYRGWEIVPSELTGRGILVRDTLDYTWDKVLGVFTLTQVGDVFSTDTYYNIHFNCIVNPAGGSYPTLSDFEIELITVSTILTASSFGKKLIVEPASNFIDITLPAIATVVQGRPLMVEVGGTGIYTVRIIDGATIVWLRGNIYMMAGETLRIYKYTRATVNEWRVDNADGNFKNVGQLVSDDAIQSDVINKQLLDGSIKDKRQYARIYNEYVLNLPIGQAVNFNDWGTGNNNRYYSLANGTDTNLFHFADRRFLYERNLLTGKSGDYQTNTVGPHSHIVNIPSSNSSSGAGKAATGSDPLGGDIPITPFSTEEHNTGGETRPETYLINKYVLI